MKPEFLTWAGRRVLRIAGGLNPEHINAILNSDDDELCLYGGEFTDLSVLSRPLKKIKRLHVMGTGPYDLDAIESLSQLEFLRLETSAKFIPSRKLNFLSFPGLESCHIYWRKEYDRNLFTLGNLKSLHLFEYDKDTLNELSELESLRELSLSQSALSNLDGIESHRSLESLTLSYLRRLTNIDALRDLSKLRRLKINNTPKLGVVGLLPIFDVVTLEEFILGSGYELPNLEPFSKLVSLREFVTASQVEIKNFSILFHLPQLNHVRFVGLRNYTDSDDDIERRASQAGRKLKLEVIGRGRKEQKIIFDIE